MQSEKEQVMKIWGRVRSRSLRAMFSSTMAIGLGAASHMAAGQPADDSNPDVQRVEITGSSIKRIAKEGALPVQVLTQADIQKTGATSTTDLLQKLPAMQGFVPAASTINGAGGTDGGGGGATTAALHSMQSRYTLVLLDGQRVAPLALGAVQGGGYGVDIGIIPLDAIERVEILTDGASALYGADAIAGVVNFITKKNKTDGNAFFTDNTPQHPGGRSYDVGISKGWGDLGTDNFNILASYSHDYQGSIESSQRPFSSTGVFPFSYNGSNYIFADRSASTMPANISFSTTPIGGGKAATYGINPYYAANGNCGTPLATVKVLGTSTSCQFNFAGTSEDAPASMRDSGLLKGTVKINGDTTAWTELLLSRYDLTEQFAAGANNTLAGFSNLYSTYVLPYAAANHLNPPAISTVTYAYRNLPLGPRADEFVTDTRHFALGIDGQAMGWSYKGTLSLSHLTDTDLFNSGYGSYLATQALVASGAYNPIMGTGTGSLGSTSLNGATASKTTSDLNVLHVGAQHDMFDLSGGTSILSLGTDFMHTHYVMAPSALEEEGSGFSTGGGLPAAGVDYALGTTAGLVPFDAARNNWGIYGEWLFPITKTFEATLSDRYDSYGRTYSKDIFSSSKNLATGLYDQLPNGNVGDNFNDNTYKASFRWAAADNLLFRGAVGTGFKAPNLSDLANPVKYSGPTTGTYACPFPGSVTCAAGTSQYSLLTGGNPLSGTAGLRPEKSNQWTLGFRVDPIKGLSIGADWWYTRIVNQVLPTGVNEQTAFANPAAYTNLFVNPYVTPTGAHSIGFQELVTNGGVAHYQGIDWDVSYQTKTPIGNLSSSWSGTYMMKQDYTLSVDGAVQSDLGQYGADDAVVFRTQMRLVLSLQTGAFTNAVTANYKSGYKDEPYSAAQGVIYPASNIALNSAVAFAGLDIGSYTTFDIQSKYQYNKALTFTGGIKNLFDRDPPLSLVTIGGGNYVGFDGRYYDPTGRTFYVNGMYKF
jgi:iron complex outermembrane receptor protein